MPKGTIRIYCDFDGTITREDIWVHFFERFVGEEIWQDINKYRNGELNARELHIRCVDKITSLSEHEIDEFCSSFSVLPSFPEFVQWVQGRGYPFMVLSDGLDAYIHRILRRDSLDLEIKANKFIVQDDGTASIAFPYSYPYCDCGGNCKRNHLLLNSGDDDYIVYIGDSISDYCPAQYADLVFAKGELEPYCQQNNISFRRFFSFNDVREVIEELEKKKRLRKPKRAELLRKAVWLSG